MDQETCHIHPSSAAIERVCRQNSLFRDVFVIAECSGMKKMIVCLLCVSLSSTGTHNMQNLGSFVLKPEDLENMRAKGRIRLVANTGFVIVP